MTDLCEPSDVTSRPVLQDVEITSTMTNQIPGYITEASILIEGYLGHTYPDPPTPPDVNPDPVPNAAKIVCARMVARAIDPRNRRVDANFDSYTAGSGMGPFTHTNTQHVATDVLGGGPWLTRQDKMALDSIGGVYSKQSNISLFDPPAHMSGSSGLLHGPNGSDPYCRGGWR